MADRNRSAGSIILSRLAGFVLDVLLLAVLLLLAVAAINILIQTIVLVVGIFSEQKIVTVDGEEVSRLSRDLKDLGIAFAQTIGAAVLFWLAVRVRRYLFRMFIDAGFAGFVSKRYLLAREGGMLVSMITLVSVLGVGVGVMALIVVISVMNGFDRELVKKFMGVFSHIEVVPDPRYVASRYIPGDIYRPLMNELGEIEGVEGVAPAITQETLFQPELGAEATKAPGVIRGIDPEREPGVTEFLDYVQEGGKKFPGPREVIVGVQLARKLQVFPGDKIYAIGKLLPTANRTNMKITELQVVGIFKSGLYDVDDKFAFANIETVQRLLVIGDEVESIRLKVENPRQVHEYGQKVLEIIPRGYGYRTWQDINPQFFEALWMEKVAMFIILLLIVLVASFNIIGTQVMTVVQKTREIGVLKSMGAGRTAIMRIFLYHGFYVGTIGTAVGTAWGLRICNFVEYDIEKIFKLPGGVYGLDRLPVLVEFNTIAFMAGCSLAICVLASIIPAIQAARLNPVEALRHE